MTNTIERAASLLRGAERVVVVTGAGVSAESGLPTFRTGAGQLWGGTNLERYGNPRGFRKHAADAWAWYEARRGRAMAATPNAAHLAIVAIERRAPRFHLVTQNIDGLHARAGSVRLLEIHGSLARVRCFDCRQVSDWPAPHVARPPHCDACGGLLRPDVVLFEESLDPDLLEEAFDAAESCDLLLSVGTSHVVQPAASLVTDRVRRGQPVIVVNPELDGLHERDVVFLGGPAGEILPALVSEAWPG
jgi:NAD-dependent deacetylase